VTTVVIIDFAHSGTTMVAGICEILGVPMVIGPLHYHPMKQEDSDIIEVLYTQPDETAFAALVEERNAKYDSWGFKLPGAWKQAAWLKKYLRDPLYIVIYKDLVSVTRRRFGKSRSRWLRKIRNTARQQKASTDGIYKAKLNPLLILSYHRAVILPKLFVRKIATAIGFNGDDDLLDKAVEYIQPNLEGPRKWYPEVGPWVQE